MTIEQVKEEAKSQKRAAFERSVTEHIRVHIG